MTLDEKMAYLSDDNFDDLKLKRIKKAFRKKTRSYKWVALAAGLVITVGGINGQPAFAARLLDVPVIGSLVRFVTYDKLSLDQAYTSINVSVIQLEGLDDKAFEAAINDMLKSRAMTVYDKALDQRQENQYGFITDVSHSYQLLVQEEDYIAFRTITTEIQASGYETNVIYNLDLKEKRLMTIKDVYSDVEALNQAILDEMVRRNQAGDAFFPDYFEGVTDETNFYVKGDNLYIVFNEYEVAAGFMGMPEVEIPLN